MIRVNECIPWVSHKCFKTILCFSNFLLLYLLKSHIAFFFFSSVGFSLFCLLLRSAQCELGLQADPLFKFGFPCPCNHSYSTLSNKWMIKITIFNFINSNQADSFFPVDLNLYYPCCLIYHTWKKHLSCFPLCFLLRIRFLTTGPLLIPPIFYLCDEIHIFNENT